MILAGSGFNITSKLDLGKKSRTPFNFHQTFEQISTITGTGIGFEDIKSAHPRRAASYLSQPDRLVSVPRRRHVPDAKHSGSPARDEGRLGRHGDAFDFPAVEIFKHLDMIGI